LRKKANLHTVSNTSTDIPDPYSQHRTPVIYKNLSPVWNFECTFIVTPVLIDSDIEFLVWDKDLIGKDFLGQLVLPLSEVSFIQGGSFQV
jgi:Ca2+-dependent lipid-binding protein